MNNFLQVLLVAISLISCSHPSVNVDKEESLIFSLIIDEMAQPFPPPPPPPKDGSTLKPINIDSINKVQVEVVIDTILFHTVRTFDLKDDFSKYQKLVDSIPSLPAKSLKTNYIESQEGHTLVFGDSLDDSEDPHSQIIGISRIAFNQKKNIAAVYVGHSTHPLASTVSLFLLKKKNGKWRIVYKERVEVS